MQLLGLLHRFHPIRRFRNDLTIWSLAELRANKSPKWFKVLHHENFDKAGPISQWLNLSQSKMVVEIITPRAGQHHPLFTVGGAQSLIQLRRAA